MKKFLMNIPSSQRVMELQGCLEKAGIETKIEYDFDTDSTLLVVTMDVRSRVFFNAFIQGYNLGSNRNSVGLEVCSY